MSEEENGNQNFSKIDTFITVVTVIGGLPRLY